MSYLQNSHAELLGHLLSSFVAHLLAFSCFATHDMNNRKHTPCMNGGCDCSLLVVASLVVTMMWFCCRLPTPVANRTCRLSTQSDLFPTTMIHASSRQLHVASMNKRAHTHGRKMSEREPTITHAGELSDKSTWRTSG